MHEYSLFDRVFHRIALGIPSVADLSFTFENIAFGRYKECQNSVYVTGLARSGTTALMRAIYASGNFASLTYGDMPFVMSPNLWRLVHSKDKKTRSRKGRPHGDGIMVDYDSPEAFEEVFWRLKCPEIYITKDAFVPHTVEDFVLQDLMRYQNLVCHRYCKTRYLAKNNNMILRLSNIAGRVKNSTFLILYRDPLEHALSLHSQHILFSKSDNFTQRYMKWLAHHEFGVTHRPYKFNTSQVNSKYSDPDRVEYWICRWIDYYSYALKLTLTNDNVHLVSYYKLCEDCSYWHALCDLIDIYRVNNPFRPSKLKITPQIAPEILSSAKNLVNELCEISAKGFDEAVTL